MYTYYQQRMRDPGCDGPVEAALRRELTAKSIQTEPHTAAWRNVSPQVPHLVYRECGGGGDCLFHSVGYALNVPQQTVRNWTAEMISQHNVDAVLNHYTHVYRVGSWRREEVSRFNPGSQARVQALRRVICTPGTLYQGDDVTLQLLSLHPRLNLALLVVTGAGQWYQHVFAHSASTRCIVLYHRPGHWQLGGQLLADGRVHVILDPWRLVDEVADPLREQNAVDMTEAFARWPGRLVLEQAPGQPSWSSSPTTSKY